MKLYAIFISWKYDHDDYLLLYGNIVIRVQKFKYCEELKSYKNAYRIAKSPHSFFDECGDFMLPGIRKKELEKFLV